jgi:DNA ligase-1
LWHGLSPPYAPLFAWLEGQGGKPVNLGAAPFRPVMLSHAIEDRFRRTRSRGFCRGMEMGWHPRPGDLGARCAGSIRAPATTSPALFPIWSAMAFDGALDGELLVARPEAAVSETGSFSDLQQRLNRKTVTGEKLREHPAVLRAYDLLQEGGEDLRSLPFSTAPQPARAFRRTGCPARFDLLAMLAFDSWDEIAALRAAPPDPVIEG